MFSFLFGSVVLLDIPMASIGYILRTKAALLLSLPLVQVARLL